MICPHCNNLLEVPLKASETITAFLKASVITTTCCKKLVNIIPSVEVVAINLAEPDDWGVAPTIDPDFAPSTNLNKIQLIKSLYFANREVGLKVCKDAMDSTNFDFRAAQRLIDTYGKYYKPAPEQ
jgi:hypothetical protein